MPPDSDGSEPNLAQQLHDNAIADEWFEAFRTRIRHQVNRKRLPSDFPADCLQAALLQVLEQENGNPQTTRATAVRLSNAARKAVLAEYAHHRRFTTTVDDAEQTLERTRGNTWLRRYFCTTSDADGRLSDEELDAADARRKRWAHTAMRLLKKNLHPTKWQLFCLRYVTPVPGEERRYTLDEIALKLRKNASYIRRLHGELLTEVRTLLADVIAERPLR